MFYSIILISTMHDAISFVFLISTILASIGLIVIIYSRNAQVYPSRIFILTLLLVIAYVISHGLHFFMLRETDVTILDKSCHSLLLLIVVTLTFFSISFVDGRKVSIVNSLIILIPSFIMLLLLWSGNFIAESHAHLDKFEAHYNPKYPLFLLWYLLLIIYSSYVLVNKFLKETIEKNKKQIIIFLFGLLFTNMTTFVFGMFLPWVLGFYYLVEISPLAFLVGLILFTSIGVNKFDMFPNILDRVHSFSLSRKIFLSALIAVPIVIVMIQIPLGRILFEINSPEAWSKYFIISLTGGGIVSLTISFIILKIIANPIEKLKNQAKEIQKGNYEIVVDVDSNDEVGELAHTFNGMAKTLKADSEELKQKESRINTLLKAFDKSFTSMVIVDDNFKILQANNIFCQLNNIKSSELTERTIEEIQFTGRLKENFIKIKNALEKDNIYDGEIELKHTNGNRKVYLINVSPFELNLGQKKGYLFLEIDISQIKELEVKLVSTEKLAAIGKMSAVLAHEVKTPLTSIKMNADILYDSLKLNDEDKESFQIINKEIKRLNNLVKEILQYARQSELNCSEFDLHKLVDSIIKNNKNKYNSKEFEIINNITPVNINADREKLYQVFLNLCENSYEAIDKAGFIQFESDIGDRFISILIKDNGKGMPADYIQKAFEAFVTTKSSGTGLGLSICKKIIEQHGGTIKIENTNQYGTTFDIKFPIHLN